MMTLEQTIQLINKQADQLLVGLTEQPESRFLITLPPLVEDQSTAPVLDCQEYTYCIAGLREVLTYKYLLCAFKSQQLTVTRESLMACLCAMRTVPFIDYYDLGDYHEYAYHYYKALGNEKKARRHLLYCYMDRGRAILSSGKTFDSKDLIVALLKEHDRTRSFLLYIINFIHYDFDEMQDFLKRSQYLLLERALVLAAKLFAENGACSVDVRSCIYYVQSEYYEKTSRPELAKVAREAFMKLNGQKNYNLLLTEFLMSQPAPRRVDECFLDYLLFIDSIEADEIYPRDDNGVFDLEIEAEDPIVLKNGRSNYMDTYYRPMPAAADFMDLYAKAERGDASAIREVAQGYRSGSGVTACACAAAAWEKRLA